MPAIRRLAAVLAADVVGYSRLMSVDEEGTHARFKAHCRQLVYPKIEEHRGRIVKNTGDGMLVEFPSVVDAVRCAVEIQRAMIDRNIGVPDDKRISFRIGINLGDVIVEPEDVYGDGVNLASRLEALAEPGGIRISRVVRDQIRDKLPYAFEDMGEENVKNIARPVRAYAMSVAAVISTPLVPTRPRPSAARRNMIPARLVIAGILVTLVGIGFEAWWVRPHAGWSMVSVQTSANSKSSPAAKGAAARPPPRLSIVVLPFTNLSNDPEQEYFADGITDDLTTDLTRITDSFVIARNTAFTYKGKAVDIKQIGNELGVRYALEGSVLRLGQQVQANVQLIDTETGAHTWAERFEVDRSDLPRAQDQIVARLARTLRLEIVEAATRRIEQEMPVNPEASDFVMRGWAWYYRPRSGATLQEAQRLFERSLEIDPRSVDARIGLALVLVSSVGDGWSSSGQRDEAHAEQLLGEALERDANRSMAHYALGRLRRMQNRLPESQIELETAVALDRNNALAFLQLANTLMFTGQPEAAIPQFEKSIRLSPHDLSTYGSYTSLGVCYLFLGRVDEAIDILKKARAGNPRLYYVHLYLAGALGFRGDFDDARAVLTEAVKLKPMVNSLAAWRADRPWITNPPYWALLEKTFNVGLRRAGFPEE